MRIQELERKHSSDLWSPAPLLERLGKAGHTFADFSKLKANS
jgi:hypothetical protein